METQFQSQEEKDSYYMDLAIQQAEKSRNEGGIPIGSVLVSNDGKILGAGHNQRVQRGSCILHGEMDCLENAGRLTYSQYKNSTIYSTLSPCDMCSGTIILYKIPRVVIGEKATFEGPTEYLRSKGIEVVNLDSDKCKTLMKEFIEDKPELWNEDIGV